MAYFSQPGMAREQRILIPNTLDDVIAITLGWRKLPATALARKPINARDLTWTAAKVRQQAEALAAEWGRLLDETEQADADDLSTAPDAVPAELADARARQQLLQDLIAEVTEFTQTVAIVDRITETFGEQPAAARRGDAVCLAQRCVGPAAVSAAGPGESKYGMAVGVYRVQPEKTDPGDRASARQLGRVAGGSGKLEKHEESCRRNSEVRSRVPRGSSRAT